MYFSFYQLTALHIAARDGLDYKVEGLIKKGAEVNVKDNDGVSVTTVVMIDSLLGI